MKDSYGREIDYLRISLTDRCNLRCLYCMAEDGVSLLKHDQIISFEEIVKVVKESVQLGITKVRLTGGEPFVRKDIYKLIKMIKSIPGVEQLTLTTNGLLIADKIKELKDLGIDRINLHLDTLDETKYKYITKSDKMLNYKMIIESCIAENLLPLKINVVLIKDFNINEVPDFIELANKYNLYVRFIELMPFGDLDFDYKNSFISSKDVLQMYSELEFVCDTKKTKYYKIANKKGRIGFISTISDKFCEDCSRIRLTSDGKLRPCLHSDLEFNIKNITKDIKEVMKQAIEEKPEKHNLENDERTMRTMNKIGG